MICALFTTYAPSYGDVQLALSSAGFSFPYADFLHTCLCDSLSMAVPYAAEHGPLLLATARFSLYSTFSGCFCYAQPLWVVGCGL